jgi:hypothetical protein
MKASYHQQIEHLKNTVKSLVNLWDQKRIFIAVDSSFSHIFKKQRRMHIHTFLCLKKQEEKRITSDSSTGPSTDNFVLNLSKHILTEPEKPVLKRGLYFSLATPQSNLDMACTVESIKKTKLPPVLGMKFSWKVRSMLQKSKLITLNRTWEEYRAIKSLELNKNISILQHIKEIAP